MTCLYVKWPTEVIRKDPTVTVPEQELLPIKLQLSCRCSPLMMVYLCLVTPIWLHNEAPWPSMLTDKSFNLPGCLMAGK